jgi:hypothetical protein
MSLILRSVDMFDVVLITACVVVVVEKLRGCTVAMLRE